MNLIKLFIALIICITAHEASHAWTAYKLGDNTPKIQGRVSLNPLKHLDLFGTIMIFIAQFGWGKPVEFNYHNLKHPRRDSLLIALAGPLANLITALLIAILLKHVELSQYVISFLRPIYQLSLVLLIFNMIPIAPLDGSKIIGVFVPKNKEQWYQDFLSKGPIYIIVLVLGDRLVAEITGFSLLGNYIQFGFEILSSLIFLAS